MPVLLDYLSVIRFTGPETAAFLQSQLSADIDALAPGGAGFACYCTPKGQVISLLLVCRLPDEFLIAGASAVLSQVVSRLKMYVLRTKVEFAPDPQLKVFGMDLSTDFSDGTVFQPAGVDLRYGIASESSDDQESCESFRAAEISRGVAWVGSATSEKFIPQMLGYDQIGALSFTKGCYPGQEIVARARYLGKVKRKPAIVRTVEPVPAKPGERVELLRNGDWSQGLLVATAAAEGGTVLFIVAPDDPGSETVELRYGDRSYRCATT